MGELSDERGVGGVIRAQRTARGLSLGALAERVRCAKSYVSLIENGRKGPPRDEMLERFEDALGMARGVLVERARLARMPDDLRAEVEGLKEDRRLARRLAELLRGTGAGPVAQDRSPLDEAYHSGELHRLIDRFTTGRSRHGADVAPASLPMEVPLINSVTAGYPTEFTDLGYPARVADEYVRCPDLHDPDAFAARVVGDSMSPDYREGDIVIFSPLRDTPEGSDCFVRLEPDHETTFKRVHFETGEGGESLIRLQPINSAHAARVVPREHVAGLYVAVSVMRSLV